MKRIIVLMLLLCAPALYAQTPAPEDLRIELILTKGERSKDSHSMDKVISVRGEMLFYDVTYSGRNARNKESVHKVFKITEDERKSLLAIIKQRNLLTSGSKEFPSQTGYAYFDISLRINAEGKESLIKLSGKKQGNPDIKEDKLIQNTEALVTEIFNILKRKDESIVYQGMF